MAAFLDNLLKNEDLFSGLNPENKQEKDKEFELNKSFISEMLKGFEKMPKIEPYFRLNDYIYLKIYETCEKNIPKDYSKSDIEDLARLLNESLLPNYLDSRKMGFYLSALCNNCPEDNIKLKLSHLPKMWYLGYRNRKNLIIEGNMTESCGYMESGNVDIKGTVKGVGLRMKYGSINIHGDCLGVGTDMNGGNIIVEGDAQNVGNKMKKGKIVINGNVIGYLGFGLNGGEIEIFGQYFGDYKVGRGMKGGVINVHKDLEFEISKDIKGGDIYQNGKALILNGRRVE